MWNTVLSKEKIEYASRDALASLLVYKKLAPLPIRQLTSRKYLSPEIPPPSASSVDTDHVSPVDPENPRPKFRVCLSPWHTLHRVNETVSIKHPLAFTFFSHLRDAVMVPNHEDF